MAIAGSVAVIAFQLQAEHAGAFLVGSGRLRQNTGSRSVGSGWSSRRRPATTSSCRASGRSSRVPSASCLHPTADSWAVSGGAGAALRGRNVSEPTLHVSGSSTIASAAIRALPPRSREQPLHAARPGRAVAGPHRGTWPLDGRGRALSGSRGQRALPNKPMTARLLYGLLASPTARACARLRCSLFRSELRARRSDPHGRAARQCLARRYRAK